MKENNLLPYDGEALYLEKFLNESESNYYFKALLETINWQSDQVKIFGKINIMKRKTAWYGNAGLTYSYSGSTKQPLPWTKELLDLKALIEDASGKTFNSCLLNLYHDGDEGMSWHSDNEKELGKNPTIASVSLGAERRFVFKNKKTKETVAVILKSGSLLIMGGTTQDNWLHELPKTKKCSSPRINLTFRTIIPEAY
ncbi:MAG TPA: alpha-ketoglutarate-dependent dioxygenase AlkB [Flavobacterium sp.]|jgi:alkylated DNA repair dioxygenase AlkB